MLPGDDAAAGNAPAAGVPPDSDPSISNRSAPDPSLAHQASPDRDELEARLSTRPLRLKAVWLVVPFFLWFVRPTPGYLAVGAMVALLGLVVRGWAAGTIRKGEELTTTGPYAFTRNPLYLGSLLLGTGITLASGYPAWTAAFLVFYLGIYARTMKGEVELLELVYGDKYRAYAANVPAFLPRFTPYRQARPTPDGVEGDGGQGSPARGYPEEEGAAAEASGTGASQPSGGGFSWNQYRRNKEWEALMGFLAVMAYLVVRWRLGA